MTKEIENRVVSMSFDNSQFEKNVSQSMKTIDKLNKSIDTLDASKALNNFSKAANKVDLSNIVKQTEAVTVKFTAMQRIAQNAIDDLYRFARNKLSGFWANTIGQISTGGMNRALNIASAKFQLEGLKVNWDDIYADINYGVKSTAYGLDAAAKAASQLVASGVQFGEAFGDTGNSPMAKALRGISGVAAMTSSSFEDISRVFTTVAGQGRLMGDQLNQLAARGLNVAATLGESLGKTEKEIRQMVSRGEIDFATFSRIMDEAFGEHAKEANKTFTGALSNMKAALSRIGADFATPYLDNMRDIFNAITPLIDNFKTALKPIYMDAEKIMKIFSAFVQNLLGKANNLQTFSNIVFTIRNVLGSLIMILVTIKEAFSEVFPPLEDISGALKTASGYLVPSEKVLIGIKTVVKALLTPIKIVLDLVKAGSKVIGTVLFIIASIVKKGFELLSMLSSLIDPLVKIVQQTDIFNMALKGLYIVLSLLISIFTRVIQYFIQFLTILKNSGAVANFVNFLKDLGGIIAGLASGALGTVVGLLEKLFKVSSDKPDISGLSLLNTVLSSIANFAAKAVNAIKIVAAVIGGVFVGIISLIVKVVRKLFNLIKKFASKFSGFVSSFKKLNDELKSSASIGEAVGKIFSFIGESAASLGERLKDVAQNLSAGKVITYVFALAIIKLLLTFERFIKAGTGLFKVVGGIGKALATVSNSFKGIVKVLDRRNMLLGFAIAIGVFAASVAVLALLPWDKVKNAAIIMGMFVAGAMVFMYVMSQLSKGNTEGIKAMAEALTGLGIALAAFAIVVSMLQNLRIDDVGSFIAGSLMMIGLIAIMTLSVIAYSKHAGEAKMSVLSLLGFAISLSIIMNAFKKSIDLGITVDQIREIFEVLFAIFAVVWLLSSIFSKTSQATKGFSISPKFALNINAAFMGLGLVIIGLGFILSQISKFASWGPQEIANSVGMLLSVLAIVVLFLAAGEVLINGIVKGVAGLFFGIASLLMSITIMIGFMKSVDLKDLKTPAIIFGIVVLAVMALIGEMMLLDKFLAKAEDEEKSLKNIGSVLNSIGKMMMSIALALAVMALTFSLIPDFKYEEVTHSIYTVLVIISVMMIVLTAILSASSGGKSFVGSIIALTIMISTLVASIAVLTLIDPTELSIAAVVVGIILIVLSLLLAVASAITFDENTAKGLKFLSLMVASLVGTILVLSFLTVFSGQIWPIIGVIAAMGVLMVALGGMFLMMKGLTTSDNGALKWIAGMVGILVIAILSLSMITVLTGQVWPIIGVILVMGVLMVALGGMFKLMSGLTEIDKSTIKWVSILIGVMGGLVALLSVLSYFVGYKNIITAAATMAGSILVLAFAMKLIGDVKIDLKSVIVMAAAAAALGLVMAVFAHAAGNAGTALAVGVAMMGVIAVLAVAMSLIDNINIKDALSIAIVVLMFSVLGAALAVFASMETTNIITVAVAIGILAMALGVLLLVLSKVGSGEIAVSAAALAIVVLTLSALVGVLGMISGIGEEGANTIIMIVEAVGALILVIAAISVVIGAISEGIPLVLVVLAAVPVVLLGISVAVLILSAAVTLLSIALEIGISAFIALFDAVVNIASTTNDLDKLAKTFTTLMFGLMKLAAGIAVVAIALGLLGAVGIAVSGGLLALGVSLLIIGAGAFVAAIGIFAIGAAIASLIESAITVIDKMFEIGYNIIAGIVEGLMSGFDLLKEAWNFIVGWLPDFISEKLVIKSPSHVFRSIGNFIMGGLVQGIVDMFPALEGVLGPIADKCFALADELEESGDTWGNAITLAFGEIQNGISNYQFDFSNILGQFAAVFGLEDILGGGEKADDWINDPRIEELSGGHAHGKNYRWKVEGYASAEEWEADNGPLAKFLKKYMPDVEELTSEFSSLTDGVGDLGGGLGDLSGYADGAATSMDNLSSSVSNSLDVFTEFNDTAEMTGKDVLRTFMGQLEGVSKWSDELSALAGRGISQAVLDDLAEAGPSAYEKVHALYSMSAAELQLFNKMYTQKLSLERTSVNQIKSSFAKGEGAISNAAEDMGAEIGTAISNGITQNVNVDEAMSEMERGVRDAGYGVVDGVITYADGIPIGMSEAIVNGTSKVVDAFGNMGYQSMEAFKNYLSMEDAIYAVEDFQTALKDSVASSISLFDEVSKEEEISSEQMIKNMTEQIKSVGRWASNLKILAERGISEGLLAELQELGPKGAAKVEAFVKMSDAQLQKANSLYASSLQLPQYVTDKLTKSYADAGYMTTLGFTEGIDPTAANAVMTALGTQSLDALKESLDIHSPSGATMEAGMYAVMGLAMGVEENLPMIQEAGYSMGDALLSNLSFSPDSILDFASNLFMSLSDAFVAKIEEFRNSPGMLMLRDTIFEMLSSVTNDMVLEPTIRPVIDTTGIEQKAGMLDNLSNLFDISGTINRAYASTGRSSSPDYSNALRDITTNQSRMLTEMQSMRNDISGLNTAMSSMQVQLDGVSVGKAITPYVNQYLGRQYSYDARRTM